jgi:4,5-dihydroxyphthalate decarboxylase
MLVTGEIDALYTPRAPGPFGQKNPAVRRLFAYPPAVRGAVPRGDRDLPDHARGGAPPRLYAETERTRQLMGEDFWTYGLAGDEAALGTLLRYSFDQGLARRRFGPAELFAPETREGYVI